MTAPLSFGEERLWWLQQLDADSVAYNIVLALRFPAGVVRPALVAALARLVQRHEVLRTRYVPDASGTPHRVVVASFAPPCTWSSTPAGGRWQDAVPDAARPFDLAVAPPVRVTVVDDEVVVLVMHHIVVDGRSLPILQRDLAALYEVLAHLTSDPQPT